MLGRLLTVAWITVVWLALWGDASWGNLVGGLAVGTFVLAALRLPATPRPRRIAARPALRYAVRFTRDLTVATAQVARQVLWPVHRLRPAVLAVPLRSGDPGLVSLVANSITLTPGTLTLEADDERRMLWVHVLHVPDEGADSVIEQAQALETLGARVLRVTLDPAGPADPAGGTP